MPFSSLMFLSPTPAAADPPEPAGELAAPAAPGAGVDPAGDRLRPPLPAAGRPARRRRGDRPADRPADRYQRQHASGRPLGAGPPPRRRGARRDPAGRSPGGPRLRRRLPAPPELRRIGDPRRLPPPRRRPSPARATWPPPGTRPTSARRCSTPSPPWRTRPTPARPPAGCPGGSSSSATSSAGPGSTRSATSSGPPDVDLELLTVTDPRGNAGLQRLAAPTVPGPRRRGRRRAPGPRHQRAGLGRRAASGSAGPGATAGRSTSRSRPARAGSSASSGPTDGLGRGPPPRSATPMHYDDTIYLADAPEVEETVLYVGDGRARRPRGPALLRRPRLRATSRGGSSVVRVVRPGEPLAIETEASVPLVIVAGDPGPEAIARLARFARDGGTVLGVLTAPGRAEALGGDRRRRASATAEEARVEPDVMLGAIDFGHALFAPLAAPQYNDFTNIRFWNYRRIDEPADRRRPRRRPVRGRRPGRRRVAGRRRPARRLRQRLDPGRQPARAVVEVRPADGWRCSTARSADDVDAAP